MDRIRRGEAAIRDFCEKREFADFVVKGGLDWLVASWEQTVRHVAKGYLNMEIEDYLNDLDGRRIIREVWPLASDEQQRRYEHRLEEADRRFIEATDPVPRCLWGEENEAKHGYTSGADWYYYRVPRGQVPAWRDLFHGS